MDMIFPPNPRRCERRRYSLDSDFGLSSSTSTIDPNDTVCSNCSTCISLNSTLENQDLVQSLLIRTDSLESLHNFFGIGTKDGISCNNKTIPAEELSLLDDASDWGDICFLVGQNKVPVYGVRDIICARSRVLCSIILAKERQKRKRRTGQPRKRGFSYLLDKLRRLRSKARRSRCEKTKTTIGGNLAIEIPEFSVNVFRRIVDFLHSGSIRVNLSNIVGVLVAADVYGLEELRSACFEFARGLMNRHTVVQLLDSAQKYQQSKIREKLCEELLQFVDQTADDILRLPSYLAASKTTAILILSRRTLRVTEEAKWDAALRWGREHCNGDIGSLRECLKSFTPNIDMLQIPLAKLLDEVTPLCGNAKRTAGVPQKIVAIRDVGSHAWDPESFTQKSSVSATCSKFSLASHSTDSGYTSSFTDCHLLV